MSKVDSVHDVLMRSVAIAAFVAPPRSADEPKQEGREHRPLAAGPAPSRVRLGRLLRAIGRHLLLVGERLCGPDRALASLPSGQRGAAT